MSSKKSTKRRRSRESAPQRTDRAAMDLQMRELMGNLLGTGRCTPTVSEHAVRSIVPATATKAEQFQAMLRHSTPSQLIAFLIASVTGAPNVWTESGRPFDFELSHAQEQQFIKAEIDRRFAPATAHV